MCFYGITLALVSPVNHELFSTVALDKTDSSVWSLSTTIKSGAGDSNLLI